jgi:selenocysteine lyase/cysteine desulfurase
MRSLSKEFGPFNGRIWLNTAHQGPLPKKAVVGVLEAIKQKISPYLISDDSFVKIPTILKEQLGRLTGVLGDEIILGNSTTCGLHILAQGIPLKAGDEILLVRDDFPASIVSWLHLQKKGIKIRFVQPPGKIIQADDLQKEIGPNTRVFCTSWVNSFNGYAIDVPTLGEICRSNNIHFIVNGSQFVGTKVINISEQPVDAITSCGFKWLCGPYGTGFCWIEPKLREKLQYRRDYWLTLQSEQSLNNMQAQEFNSAEDSSISNFDVFCTANFFNYVPWIESIRLLLRHSLEKIWTYNLELVLYFINKLDLNHYKIISSQSEKSLSTLIVITNKDPKLNYNIFELLKKEGIDISLREGNLRISPHIFNTIDELDDLLAILRDV